MAQIVDPGDNSNVMIYRFDEFELDTGLFELRRAGVAVPLEPQVYSVLAYLVEHGDRVVTKTELLDHVWGDRFISEAALTSRLMTGRKALGDSGQQQRYIKTVHGRGYRFWGAVKAEARRAVHGVPAPDAIPTRAAVPEHQQIRLCTTSDGTRIAYATSGAGPPLVKVANWMSHLEFDWRSPVWRHWIAELSRDHTLVRYDERGCGLSDRDVQVQDYSVDTWVRDLESVVDALELERFPLLGISQGGPVAIAYAVRHPERVSKLILYGAYLKGRAARATTQDEIDENEALITLSRLWWGRDDSSFLQIFARRFVPEGSAEHQRWFNDLCRVSTSAENAARFRRAFSQIDVAHLLDKLSLPVIVLHAIDDQSVPIEQGRMLAAGITGAKFVPLNSKNHVLLEDEPAWPRFLDEVRTFLGVAPGRASGDADSVHAILFTDLAEAGPPQERRGEDTFRATASEHEREVEELVVLHGGGAVRHAGGGLSASFPSAVRAVECAVAIQHAAQRRAKTDGSPLRARAGVHAADPVAQAVDDDGIAFTTASRIAERLAGGEIAVSDVVRQLVAGKGFLFSQAEPLSPEGSGQRVDIYRVQWSDVVSAGQGRDG